jgi:hypothetical protein
MPRVAQNTPELSLALPAQALTRRRETMKQVVPFGAPAAPPREVPKQVPAHRDKDGKKGSYMVTAKRAAAMLELAPEEVDALLDGERIPFSKVRGRRMVDFDDVIAYAYAVDREEDAAFGKAMEGGAVTVEQAARYLDLPVKGLARRIKAGDLPTYGDADGKPMVRTADLLAFRKTLERENSALDAEIFRKTAATGAYERQTPEFMKKWYESHG